MYKFLGMDLWVGFQRGYVACVRWKAIDFQPLGSAGYEPGRLRLWVLTAAAPRCSSAPLAEGELLPHPLPTAKPRPTACGSAFPWRITKIGAAM